MIGRFAACFHDEWWQNLIEHEVAMLVGQRVIRDRAQAAGSGDDDLASENVRSWWKETCWREQAGQFQDGRNSEVQQVTAAP
jgi:hypothetical protein